MNKYIDVEWLEENAKEYSLGYYEDDEWATPLNVLDSAPSIDIVRCEECRHWRSGVCLGIPFNGDDASYIETEADDYCSYGEREGE